MKSRHVLVVGALALALSACGQSSAPSAEPPVAAPATDTAATPAPVETAPVATGSKLAAASDCATTISGNDAMQYDADSIAVPATCAQFTITLRHAGTMAVGVMGHNLVIAKESDMAGIAADGMAVMPEHVKPDDARVIAHTRMIGGGESASVTFDVAGLKDGGPFKFFCSFPGHLTLMQGSLVVR